MLPVISARLLIALTVSVPFGAVIHPHRPGDEGRAGRRHTARPSGEQLRFDPGDLRHALGCVVADRLTQRIEAGRVALDVLVIDEIALR